MTVRKLPTIRLDLPGAKRVPWWERGPLTWWKRRHWVDASVILARDIDEMGDSERVMEATRRRVRAAYGWPEERIMEMYPRGRRP
jgi:hypothetical protein